MIQQLFHRLLSRRHFWRHASFDEVGELYASRLLRMFALRIITTFTAIYMYQEGYSLVFLSFFWALFYGLKVVFSYFSARIAAAYGPKHGTLISNIVSAIGMVFFPFVPQYGLYALLPWCILQAFSSCLNDLCYLIDFSKVKHSEHAGKEIGFMNIVEKIATGVSPFIGGLLAFLFSPELVMLLSAVLFLMAAWPLLMTAEPVRLHQKLSFKGYPWRLTWRSLVAEAAVGYDVYVTGTVWSLFMVAVIFVNNGDEVYAKIGALSSVTIISALLASHAFGRLIDRHQGGMLLRVGVIVNSLTHFFRPFIGAAPGIVAVNMANEAATTGYSMAFMRGMFDTADLSGFRIMYLFLIEVVVNFGAMLAGLAMAVLFMFVDMKVGFTAFFWISAVVVLMIATPKFHLYQR